MGNRLPIMRGYENPSFAAKAEVRTIPQHANKFVGRENMFSSTPFNKKGNFIARNLREYDKEMYFAYSIGIFGENYLGLKRQHSILTVARGNDFVEKCNLGWPVKGTILTIISRSLPERAEQNKCVLSQDA